ncbi:hypothetical protein ACO1O0_006575 [Amphichorda felina]
MIQAVTRSVSSRSLMLASRWRRARLAASLVECKTRAVLHGPEPESKNRILRNFPRFTDFFLRCLFCDDNGQDLAFNPNVANDAVYERYRRVLREGMQVAGRRFSFLGFSHSSLRS